MMKRISLVVALLALTVLSAFAPTTKTIAILVHNNQEEAVKVTMDGPVKYVFTAVPGWTEKVIEPGSYKVTYAGCLEEVTVEVDLDATGQIFDIPYCPPMPDISKFVVYSHFEEPLQITLTSLDPIYGEDYVLATELGTNRYYNIQTGWYTYSYDVCDTTFTGSVRVLKNGTASMTIISCERLIYQDLGKPNPVRLTLNNYYGSDVVVTLLGPATYYFTLSPGQTKVDVISGVYTYIYAMDGKRYEGAIYVSKSGITSVAFPGGSQDFNQ
ncbi:MAG: hypothetical protein EPO32_07650 [Anaerolineae bacterium]|nr:MAG: hypothetical protein EPO32_07650 [Anaerolineae bacterium]